MIFYDYRCSKYFKYEKKFEIRATIPLFPYLKHVSNQSIICNHQQTSKE